MARLPTKVFVTTIDALCNVYNRRESCWVLRGTRLGNELLGPGKTSCLMTHELRLLSD